MKLNFNNHINGFHNVIKTLKDEHKFELLNIAFIVRNDGTIKIKILFRDENLNTTHNYRYMQMEPMLTGDILFIYDDSNNPGNFVHAKAYKITLFEPELLKAIKKIVHAIYSYNPVGKVPNLLMWYFKISFIDVDAQQKYFSEVSVRTFQKDAGGSLNRSKDKYEGEVTILNRSPDTVIDLDAVTQDCLKNKIYKAS